MGWQKKIDKKNVLEEYKKRFSEILEYTMPNSDLMNEDGEDEMPPMGNEEGAAPEGNNAMPQGGEMGEMPQGGEMGEMPQGGEMPPMGNEEGASSDLTANFNPQVPEGDETMPQGGEMGEMPQTTPMQPEDEVIDITDLTDAQEETLSDIKNFDKKFVSAFKAIKSLEKMIDSNNAKIDELQNELKKRNPTPMEKMGNRASLSYPFNVSPEEYWDKKEATSNYRTADDNNGKDEEYTITVGDVNNASDWKSISDSIDDDFMYNQTLEKLLKM